MAIIIEVKTTAHHVDYVTTLSILINLIVGLFVCLFVCLFVTCTSNLLRLKSERHETRHVGPLGTPEGFRSN